MEHRTADYCYHHRPQSSRFFPSDRSSSHAQGSTGALQSWPPRDRQAEGCAPPMEAKKVASWPWLWTHHLRYRERACASLEQQRQQERDRWVQMRRHSLPCPSFGRAFSSPSSLPRSRWSSLEKSVEPYPCWAEMNGKSEQIVQRWRIRGGKQASLTHLYTRKNVGVWQRRDDTRTSNCRVDRRLSPLN
jgi:hypothetical protein